MLRQPAARSFSAMLPPELTPVERALPQKVSRRGVLSVVQIDLPGRRLVLEMDEPDQGALA
jgi:P2-related tail formation protein